MVAGSEGYVAERVQENSSQCQHHWLIDVAGGPTSKGVCRLCGAERLFKNALDSAEWDSGEPTFATAPTISVPTGSDDDLEDEL